MPSHKVCTKCGEDKPLSEYYKHKGGRNGLRSQCKECIKQATAAWQAANPDRARAAVDKYRATHPRRVKAMQKAYRAAHPEVARAANRKYRAAHPEQISASCRKYRAANLEKDRARCRAHAAAHREEQRNYAKRYRATAVGKASCARTSAKRRIRVLQTDAAIALTTQEWQARIAEYNSHCCWCGKELAEDEIVMDHIVALANGGAHIASNVAPSCGDCNAHKHTQDWGYPVPGILRDRTI